MLLSTKQKQHLKSLSHPLNPVVIIGNNGLTEGVMVEIEQALLCHELIKIRISGTDRDLKNLIADTIVKESHACKVQVVGKVLTLYRPSDEKKITLPR